MDMFIRLIRKIKNGFREGKMEKTEKHADELGKMITTDPRLGDFLEMDFLKLLVQLLECEHRPYLQAYAATILRPVVTYLNNSEDIVVVIGCITPVVLKLISSTVNMVRVEALWLLRNLVFAISISSVEEALDPITTLIVKGSIGYGVLHPASETLLVTCQVHPKLSHEKLNLVLPALMKLIESNVLILLTSGCWGLALLCDGREEMIIEDKYLDRLITRLVDLMNSIERVMVISALHALGSIVRWGSDDVIEAIIKEDGALLILSVLLDEDDIYVVKQTCWILSNITAGKEKHIRAVIAGVNDGKLIDPLVKVVQNFENYNVRKEASWAISNVMCGVALDQIECLRNGCSDLLWEELLLTFCYDSLFVLVALEGLVNIQVVKVSWNGRPIDGVLLHSLFKKIVEDSDWFSRSIGGWGVPRFFDDNVQKSDDDNVQKFVDNTSLLFKFVSRPRLSISIMYDPLNKYLHVFRPLAE